MERLAEGAARHPGRGPPPASTHHHQRCCCQEGASVHSACTTTAWCLQSLVLNATALAWGVRSSSSGEAASASEHLAMARQGHDRTSAVHQGHYLVSDNVSGSPQLCADVQGLSRTLFERLQGMYSDSISEVLTVQYRMHAAIMEWSSHELYHGKLTAHASVASHTLSDMQVRHLPHRFALLQVSVACHQGALPVEQKSTSCRGLS